MGFGSILFLMIQPTYTPAFRNYIVFDINFVSCYCSVCRMSETHIIKCKGLDAMKLDRIESRFEEIKRDYREPQRTDELVLLMNALEAEHGTFKVWNDESAAPDLTTPEMRLYREISNARWSE